MLLLLLLLHKYGVDMMTMMMLQLLLLLLHKYGVDMMKMMMLQLLLLLHQSGV